jgi:DNA-binding transcriptional ArsR family regulator
MSYHLRYLEKEGLITCKFSNGYNRYYAIKLNDKRRKDVSHLLSQKCNYKRITPNDFINWFKYDGIPNEKAKIIINHLRCNTPRDIISVLLLFPGSSQKEIGEYLNKHRTTVSFHLKKLINADLVEYIIKNNEYRYKLKDPDNVFLTFIRSFGFKPAIEDIDETFEYIILESIIKKVFEIFPHPYHA